LKTEAQAKELAGIALESSFACVSGFEKRAGISFSDLAAFLPPEH
jgi:hypothetical protein